VYTTNEENHLEFQQELRKNQGRLFKHKSTEVQYHTTHVHITAN